MHSYAMRHDGAPAPNQQPEGIPFSPPEHAVTKQMGSINDPAEVSAVAKGPELRKLEWKRLLVEETQMEREARHQSEQIKREQQAC